MSDRHSLRLAIVPRPGEGSFSGLDHWLRMEQILGDDRATTEDMAEIVDELYGIEACSPEPTPEEEPPPMTWERLMEIAARRLDIEECRRMASGDYTARVKVIYDRPDDKDNRPEYSVTIGRIAGKTIVGEEVTKTITVREQTSVVLDVPVPHPPQQKWPGMAKWLGSVYSDEAGAIPPPEIIGQGNVLRWGVVATGTILVKVPTVYELVTVEVPGIPKLGSLAGDSQDTTLRAFYRLQVYELEVRAISTDTTADGQTLAKLCGWDSYGGGTDGTSGSSGSSTGDDAAADDEQEDDGPPMGCLDYDKELADPAYYEQVCCAPPPPTLALPDCLVYAVPRPTRELSAEVKKSYEDDHRGKVSFIPVGPGPDGCGRQFRRQVVRQKSCCDQLEIPLTYDNIHSGTTISQNGVMEVWVYGGMRPVLAVRVKGQGFWLDAAKRRKQIAITSTRNSVVLYVYADDTACGYGEIEIADGCSIVMGFFRCTAGQWVAIDPWDCELRKVAAQWTEGGRYSSGQGAYAWFWYQDDRYKIRQKYWLCGYAGTETYYSGSGFDAACSQCTDVNWEALIPSARADRDEKGFTVWDTWPELIDVDNALHLVTEYVSYFHGIEFFPDYGNIILTAPGALGGEHLKTYYSYYPNYACKCSLAYALGTGWRTGSAFYPDSAEAQAWEWQC